MLRLKLALYAAASVLALAALQAAASGAPPAETNATSAYQGTFRGKTAQGKPFSFVVGAGDRVVRLGLAYALPGCDVKQQITTSAPIKGGAFTFSLNLPNNAVSLRGRFTSKLQASGTLIASGDCGRVSTTWKAAKGAATSAATPKPKPTTKPKSIPTPFKGSWEGKVTLPVGLDPELKDYLDPTLLFDNFDGGIEAVDLPFLIQGAGCATGDFGVAKEFSPPVKLKGKTFSLSFTTKNGIRVALAGTFDSAKRAHGTLTTKGSFEGCTGEARLTWRASNLG